MRHSLSPSLFSLEFSNLPKNVDKETLIIHLKNHLEKTLDAHKKHKEKFKIVDIQLQEKNRVIGLEDDKGYFIKKVHLFNI